MALYVGVRSCEVSAQLWTEKGGQLRSNNFSRRVRWKNLRLFSLFGGCGQNDGAKKTTKMGWKKVLFMS